MINTTFKISILLLINCLLFNYSASASSIIGVKKKGHGGHDPCQRIDCLDLGNLVSEPNVPYSEIDVEININKLVPSSQFAFPWHIKAKSLTGRHLGQSGLIHGQDFIENPINNNLRKVDVLVEIDATLLARFIRSQSAFQGEGCEIDQCGILFDDIDIVFSIYSGTNEITMQCQSFNSSYLEAETHVQISNFRTCDCADSFSISEERDMQEFEINLSRSSFDIFQRLQESMTPANSTQDLSIDSPSFQVFPNPAESFINVRILPPNSETRLISLKSIEGKKIKEQKINGNQDIVSFNLSGLPGGVYIISYQSSSRMYSKKVIVNP